MKKQTKDAVLFVRLTEDMFRRVNHEAAKLEISAAAYARAAIRDALAKTKGGR